MLKTGSEEVSAGTSKMSSYTENPCSLVDIYETLQVFKGALVSPWSLWNFKRKFCVSACSMERIHYSIRES